MFKTRFFSQPLLNIHSHFLRNCSFKCIGRPSKTHTDSVLPRTEPSCFCFFFLQIHSSAAPAASDMKASDVKVSRSNGCSPKISLSESPNLDATTASFQIQRSFVSSAEISFLLSHRIVQIFLAAVLSGIGTQAWTHKIARNPKASIGVSALDEGAWFFEQQFINILGSHPLSRRRWLLYCLDSKFMPRTMP